MKQLSIYIHIPFCVRKCSYCDFLSFPSKENEREEYVETLLEEIRLESSGYAAYEVRTVFFGGGTPSLLTPAQMERIMVCLRESFRFADCMEISVEANPGTVNRESLSAYLDLGFNRLSLGLQSSSDRLLRKLGRIHTFDMFLEAYEAARAAGFGNVNVDVMSALPGQSAAQYCETLQKVLSLTPRPTHISAYSLIVEEGTPFYERQKEGRLPLPTEDEEREMYALTARILGREGYERYEISNYARPGFACRHNLVYWTRENYLGLGLGAASMVENIRMSNEDDMEAYSARIKRGLPRQQGQKLSVQEQMEETMFLGLRLADGVEKEAFARTFGRSMESVYGNVLAKHERNGLLISGDRVRLTGKGIDVSNYVMADFLF
ncbi:MAG: oxygen-independent coproporphyrinogen III oxidase [Lachnospiraceae bacterium]|nr:oxygen-independent coproporphyrinogen III oxidase [Lachnospiraceae bacterium]